MHLRARVFNSLEELAPYADRWNEMVLLSPGNSIFLTWEWLSAWKTHVANGIPLYIVTVFDENEVPLAFLPLYESSFQLLKCIRYQCLRPMGDCHCGAEYPDIIAAPDSMTDVLTCLQEFLERQQPKWECLYFRYISGRTSAVTRLTRLIPARRAFCRSREAVFSSIALPENIEELDRNMSKSLSLLVRRQKRKLEQLGRLTINICQHDQEIPLYLDSLFDLHRKRWESVGQQGSFIRRPLMRDFYTGFAAKALEKGWLKIFALQIDSVTLAIQIGYLYHGVFSQMQEGFDPSGPGGLGNVLRHEVLKWCINNKVKEYDYLGGDEEQKLKWGAKQQIGYHLFCGAKSLKNSLLATANIWPSGRFIVEGPPASYGYSHD